MNATLLFGAGHGAQSPPCISTSSSEREPHPTPTAPWHRGEAEFELSSPSEWAGGAWKPGSSDHGFQAPTHYTHRATETTRNNQHASPRIHRALFVFLELFMGFWKFLCRTLRARLVPGVTVVSPVETLALQSDAFMVAFGAPVPGILPTGSVR